MCTKRPVLTFVAGVVLGAAVVMPIGAGIRRTQFARIAELEAQEQALLADRAQVVRLAVATSNLAETAEAYTRVCHPGKRSRARQLVSREFTGVGGD